MPQQVLVPSFTDTRLLMQPAEFAGDRTKWADRAFTFRAYASAVSTRVVVMKEHAQGGIEPLDLPVTPGYSQVNDSCTTCSQCS